MTQQAKEFVYRMFFAPTPRPNSFTFPPLVNALTDDKYNLIGSHNEKFTVLARLVLLGICNTALPAHKWRSSYDHFEPSPGPKPYRTNGLEDMPHELITRIRNNRLIDAMKLYYKSMLVYTDEGGGQ